MNKLQVILLSAFCTLTWAATAQDTNILKTEIGVFENRTGVVIVKGFGQIGSVTTEVAEISVRCKETADISIGQKLYGLAIQITGTGFQAERIYVDEDEIDALLSGINYLIKINYEVTSLPGFEASYTSKGGLQVLANSIRKEGGVRFSLQGNYGPQIPLSSIQMTQLYNLITQARKNLDVVKAGK